MSDESANKISAAELKIMKALWEAGTALPVTAIRERLSASQGWEATTIKTLVSRLCKKGALKQEKRGVFYYLPCLSRDEYNAWAAGEMVDRLFHGSAQALVAALVKGRELSDKDIDELRSMFRGEAR